MKLKFLLLIIIITSFSCALTPEIQAWWDYDESLVPVEIKTKDDIMRFCFSTYYISFDTDQHAYGKKEYFAFPKETLKNKSGDCEDRAFLALAMLYKIFNIKGVFVIGNQGELKNHAYIEINGKSYNKQDIKYIYSKTNFDNIALLISCNR